MHAPKMRRPYQRYKVWQSSPWLLARSFIRYFKRMRSQPPLWNVNQKHCRRTRKPLLWWLVRDGCSYESVSPKERKGQRRVSKQGARQITFCYLQDPFDWDERLKSKRKVEKLEIRRWSYNEYTGKRKTTVGFVQGKLIQYLDQILPDITSNLDCRILDCCGIWTLTTLNSQDFQASYSKRTISNLPGEQKLGGRVLHQHPNIKEIENLCILGSSEHKGKHSPRSVIIRVSAWQAYKRSTPVVCVRPCWTTSSCRLGVASDTTETSQNYSARERTSNSKISPYAHCRDCKIFRCIESSMREDPNPDTPLYNTKGTRTS